MDILRTKEQTFQGKAKLNRGIDLLEQAMLKREMGILEKR